MSTPEELHSFNTDDWQKAVILRKQVAFLPRFNDEQITNTLSILEKREQQYLDHLRDQPLHAQAELDHFNRKLKEEGTLLSRPSFTVKTILDGTCVPLQTIALNCYGDPSYSKHVFIGFFDYLNGIVDVVSGILKAEQELQGATDEVIREGLIEFEENKELPLPLSFTSESYLLGINESKKMAQLLIDDATGFSVIARGVKEIRADASQLSRSKDFHRISSYQEERLVLAGAEFAQQAYEAIYPLTI